MAESLLVDRVIQAGPEPQLESVCEKWKGSHGSDAGGQRLGRRKSVEQKPRRGLTWTHAQEVYRQPGRGSSQMAMGDTGVWKGSEDK